RGWPCAGLRLALFWRHNLLLLFSPIFRPWLSSWSIYVILLAR
ncbi:hypothetical protein LINPERPRIM_LOCUS41884, partial [Linum perenne]